ncbi:hypothetical protein [Bryocella elongata]|nr:hypothetical protein [Bryocella elongata]
MNPRFQNRLSQADLATFFLAGVVGIAAGNLTYLALMNPDHFLEPLRSALSPGLYAVWLMAGDATGSVTPEGWVPGAAVFLNAVVYAAGVMVPRLLWCHVTSRHALRPQA